MKNMHKKHIFDQKNNAKLFFLPYFLFISDRYRKQTISFFRPYYYYYYYHYYHIHFHSHYLSLTLLGHVVVILLFLVL